MKKANDIRAKVEETLSSFDSIQQATANPFLYSKIMNRLQERHTEMFSGKHKMRLAWQLTIAMALFISLNITGVYILRQERSQQVQSEENSLLSAVNEYTANTINYNY